jgi:flagellar biogenesis protein FliO
MSRGAACALGLVAALAPATGVLADGDKGVRPGQSVAEILGREPAAAPASPAPAPGGSSQRGAAILTGVLVLAAAGICLVRRRKAHSASSGDGGSVEIVGRAALSHKHSVCVVRVGDARIVIGLAGDRMSPLAVLEGSSAPPDRAPAGRVGRPPLPELSRGRLDPDELERYRKQVDRLKGLLRGPLRNAAREIGSAP